MNRNIGFIQESQDKSLLSIGIQGTLIKKSQVSLDKIKSVKPSISNNQKELEVIQAKLMASKNLFMSKKYNLRQLTI